MKRPFLIHPHQHKSVVSLFGLALFFLLVVLGCSRGGDEAPVVEGAPQQQGTLVCSEECAARGQCGKTIAGNESVILGHPDHPACARPPNDLPG